MVLDNATDIQVIVQVTQSLIIKKFMVRVSHGLSGIRRLSPSQWEADTLPSGNAENVCQPDTIIIAFFHEKSQVKNGVLVLFKRAVSTSHKLKHGVLTPKIDKTNSGIPKNAQIPKPSTELTRNLRET